MSDINSLVGASDGLTTGLPDLIVLGTGTSRPGGVETVLEYNGTLLNFRDWVDTYIVSSIDGLADPDVRDSREVNPGRHGETHFDAYYGGRTIVLTGKIRAHTLDKLRDMQMGLKQVFGDISQELPLKFRHPDPTNEVFINCKKSQPIVMAETQQNFQHERDFQITLRASDPFFYSNIQYSDSGNWGDHETFSLDTEFLGPINIVDNPDQTDTAGVSLSVTGTLDNTGSASRGAWTTGQMAGLTESYLILKSRAGTRFPASAGNDVGVAVYAGLDNVVSYTGWTLRARLRFYNAAGASLGTSNLSQVFPTDSTATLLYGTAAAPANTASFQIEVFADKSTTGLARRITLYSAAAVINPPATMDALGVFYGGANGAWLGAPNASISRRRSTSGLESYEPSPFPESTQLQTQQDRLKIVSDSAVYMAAWRLEALSTLAPDGRYSIRYKTGADVVKANCFIDLAAKFESSDYTYAYARVNFTNATATFAMRMAGAGGGPSTDLVAASNLPAALLPNTEYIITISFDGNDVTATHAKADGTQLKTISATLAGGDATRYGTGVTGRYGFIVNAENMNGWWIDDHMFEPAETSPAISLSVGNDGNVNTNPIIRIHGTLNASVNNGLAAEIRASRMIGNVQSVQAMRLNAYGGSKIAIPSGNYLEIDSQKRTIQEYTSEGVFVRNAFEQLDVSSEWLEMHPGITDFELDTFGPSSPKLEIFYRHAFL